MDFITTTREPSTSLIEYAKSLGQKYSLCYIDREKYSIAKLKFKYHLDSIIVAGNDKLTLELKNTSLYFHPNMAQVRIKRLRNGGVDNLLEALGVSLGMSVLDCTLGFASDAIISSYGVGSEGKIVGLESNPHLSIIIREGLKNYRASNMDLAEAMQRIEVINSDYLDYLKNAPSNSFDIIYFDPMFRHTLADSKSMDPLRNIANYSPLSRKAIEEAKRVARRRVVFKENTYSREFLRLGFTDIQGGKYSPIKYGIIRLDD